MGKIKEAAEATDLAPAKPQEGIKELLDSQWHKIEAVMTRNMDPQRLFQLSVSAINTTPKLAQCTSVSILSCVMKCAALGLEPSAVDGLGRAYILPYNNYNKATKKYEYQATFILGYKGMLDLARRSGEIKDISARAVYEGDEFEYAFGLDEVLRHIPSTEPKDKRTLTHVYMVCHFRDGGHYIDVMTAEEVESVRKRSKAADKGPWVTDYEAMAKKTVIRRAFPYLPATIEARDAVAADETDGGFVPKLEFDPIVEDDVIDLPEPEALSEAPAAAEAVEDTTKAGLANKQAVCTFCGNTIRNAAADATLEDLNQDGHCEHPHYEWAK